MPKSENSRGHQTLIVGKDTYRLRKLDIDDVDDMHRLDKICFDPEQAFSEGFFLLLFVFQKSFGWALDFNGNFVAFILVTKKRKKANIATIDVHPDYQGRGLGKSLMKLAEDRLRTQGITTCTLQVDVKNEGAIALYTKLGFEIECTMHGYYAEQRDAYMMRKKLNSN